MSKKAVVLHHGRQFELEVGKETVLPRVEGQEGEEIVFKDVLAVLKDDGDITVGAPKIEGASVSATILKQYKGKKILIFKKKRRKGYKKKQGYRESLSRVQVKDISL
ncbi:MAG: 50S ribosomal protein L21 [Candidatus Dadabacteria bacterium]|nr:MAG: 50S ribosomal protein L21 [Candidatus Dadabacteria bacterium]